MNFPDNYFLRGKNKGYNQNLTGKVGFVYILVSDPQSNWKNQHETDQCVKIIKRASQFLMKKAAEQHVNLEIRDFIMKARADYLIHYNTPYGWHNDVVRSMNRSCLRELQNEIKNKMNLKEVAVIFLFHRTERSFAHHVTTNLSEDEFAVVFAPDQEATICHEILHLFGAIDYYYIDRVIKAARQYLGSSIMLSASPSEPIDDFTMFLIGWHNHLTPNASAFLQAAGYVSDAELRSAVDAQVKDGYGRITYPNGTVYEGTLKHGVPDGRGTYTYPGGNKYTGELRASYLHGRGKMIYADGNTYDGEWENSVMKGRGVLTYNNGGYYVGEFADNTFNGYGEYHPPFGRVQKGIWKNGKLI